MATKIPIVMYSGRLGELKAGDEIATGASKLLQWAYRISDVEASGSVVMPGSTAAPLVTHGNGYSPLTFTFTPAAASSILEVHFELVVGASSGSNHAVALFDSLAGASAVGSWYGLIYAGYLERVCLTTFLAAGSTAARAFSVRYGCVSAYTTYVNRTSGMANLHGAALRSVLSVKEYAP